MGFFVQPVKTAAELRRRTQIFFENDFIE